MQSNCILRSCGIPNGSLFRGCAPTCSTYHSCAAFTETAPLEDGLSTRLTIPRLRRRRWRHSANGGLCHVFTSRYDPLAPTLRASLVARRQSPDGVNHSWNDQQHPEHHFHSECAGLALFRQPYETTIKAVLHTDWPPNLLPHSSFSNQVLGRSKVFASARQASIKSTRRICGYSITARAYRRIN